MISCILTLALAFIGVSGFKPLRCGAVISCPECSLPEFLGCKFQTPSLRGGDQLKMTSEELLTVLYEFQTPSLRGGDQLAG